MYQSLRMKKINLDLVSMTEIEEELFSISKPEIKCQKILVSSRCARLNRRNSHSRLKVEKVTLVDLWPTRPMNSLTHWHFQEATVIIKVKVGRGSGEE